MFDLSSIVSPLQLQVSQLVVAQDESFFASGSDDGSVKVRSESRSVIDLRISISKSPSLFAEHNTLT